MVEVITGTSDDDALTGVFGADNVIFGLAGADTLRGSSGNDRLFGGRGNDTLYLSGGIDFLFGGSGDDTYVLSGSFGSGTVVQIFEEEGAGTDTILINTPFVWYGLSRNIENVEINANVEVFRGNDADNFIDASSRFNDMTFFAGAGDDVILGTRSYDYIDGGTGADRMEGGRGIDRYIVDNRGDVVIEQLDFVEYDQVDASVNYRLGDGVEGLVLTGSAQVGRGNDLDNPLVGNAENNRLFGYGGSDNISAGPGRDRVFGGEGDDLVFGGRGRDVLFGEEGQDTFVFLSHRDTGSTQRQADRIRDFEAGDLIDLSAVDGNANRPNEQAFDFIGNDAFSGTAGELRYANGFLRGDRDGDGQADFFLGVNGSLADVTDALIIG